MNNNEKQNTKNQVSTETSTKPQKKIPIEIILLILGFILIVAGAVYTFFIYKDRGKKSNSSIDDFSITKTEYAGLLIYEPSKQITDVFNITVPIEFIDMMEGNNNIVKELMGNIDGIFNSCKVELAEVINFNDANLLAKSMSKYHNADVTLTTKKINGIKWYNFQYESLGTNDMYITDKDGHVFVFVYEVGRDANKEVCNQYMPEIINSVSYK